MSNVSISDLEYAIRFCDRKDRELVRDKYYVKSNGAETEPKEAGIIADKEKETNEWRERKKKLLKLMEQKIRTIA